MKALVYYIDFHWDNHQGGSGKSFNMRATFDLPVDLCVMQLRAHIEKKLSEHITKQRPFSQKEAASIIRIELI